MAKKLTIEQFIEKAEIIHSNRYDYSLIEYRNSNIKVKIICKEHGIFEQRPRKHLDGQGCVMCSGKKKNNTKDFIGKARLIHNDKYNYDLVDYKNNNTKIKIVCVNHGIFTQIPRNHLSGQGCIMCTKLKKLTKEEFITRANLIHKNKYDYPNLIYKNSFKKVKILCKIHGEFEQIASVHLLGRGCKICGYNTITKTKKEFIFDSKVIHKDKYRYDSVNYFGSHINVDIECKKHGFFKQTPSNHLKGYGCSKCSSSLGENKIINFLDNFKILYQIQYKFEECKNKKKLPFDFYLPEYNICIEYDGELHFVEVEHFGGKEKIKHTQKTDKIKTDFCKNNNIKLIRIPYWDFKNIEKILKKELNIKCVKN